MADRSEMFRPTRNHAKCCRADPCCHDNEMWTRRGDPVAYRLVRLSVTRVIGFHNWGSIAIVGKPNAESIGGARTLYMQLHIEIYAYCDGLCV